MAALGLRLPCLLVWKQLLLRGIHKANGTTPDKGITGRVRLCYAHDVKQQQKI